jgi:hypothetical protein
VRTGKNRNSLKLTFGWGPGHIWLHATLEDPWPHYTILEVCWDGLRTLPFGLSQFHGHGSPLVCDVALTKSKVAWVSSISLNQGSIGRVMAAITSSSEWLSRVDWETTRKVVGMNRETFWAPIFFSFPHFNIHVWPFIDDDFGIWQGTTLDILSSKFHASVIFDICRDNSGYSNGNCARECTFLCKPLVWNVCSQTHLTS